MSPNSSSVSSSSTSCVTQVGGEDAKDPLDDRQILCLLDALNRLLRSRDTLAQTLSRGWMDIASARYAMGPSRISQAVFSLKPCPASTFVSVSPAEDAPNAKDGANHTSQFTLRIQCQGIENNDTALGQEEQTPKISMHSELRQRHTSGVSNNKHVETGSKGSVNHSMVGESTVTQEAQGLSAAGGSLKQRSEALAWFGTLVSPHLRTAQSSFAEALETLVELATLQSSVLAAYHQIKQDGGLG